MKTPKRAPLTELEFLKDPTKWPRWPVLPLKRTNNGQLDPGFLLAQKGMLTTVHMGSIYDTNRIEEAAKGGGKNKKYPSYEVILSDGWSID